MRDQLQAVSRRQDLLWHPRLLLSPNIILNGKCPEKVFEYLNMANPPRSLSTGPHSANVAA